MSEILARQLVGASSGLLPYFVDDTVTDILINGPGILYVESNGRLRSVPSPFADSRQILDFIERLLIPLGRRVDAANPYLDGRLLDGSRFHLVLPPIAVGGPWISIRKSRRAALAPLATFGEPKWLSWLVDAVKSGRNVLVAGGTGAGKTTLISRLLDEVDPAERIVVIEESAEIASTHPHQISLESRPPSPDGTGEVTLRALIRNSLRMRPNRIVLGECRGAEAFDLVQAMNTGHPGSLCTLHANGALEALRRLEALVLMAGLTVPPRTVRDWIASAVEVVVFLRKQGDSRYVAEILEVNGTEGEVFRILPQYRAVSSAHL